MAYRDPVMLMKEQRKDRSCHLSSREIREASLDKVLAIIVMR